MIIENVKITDRHDLRTLQIREWEKKDNDVPVNKRQNYPSP